MYNSSACKWAFCKRKLDTILKKGAKCHYPTINGYMETQWLCFKKRCICLREVERKCGKLDFLIVKEAIENCME